MAVGTLRGFGFLNLTKGSIIKSNRTIAPLTILAIGMVVMLIGIILMAAFSLNFDDPATRNRNLTGPIVTGLGGVFLLSGCMLSVYIKHKVDSEKPARAPARPISHGAPHTHTHGAQLQQEAQTRPVVKTTHSGPMVLQVANYDQGYEQSQGQYDEQYNQYERDDYSKEQYYDQQAYEQQGYDQQGNKQQAYDQQQYGYNQEQVYNQNYDYNQQYSYDQQQYGNEQYAYQQYEGNQEYAYAQPHTSGHAGAK